MSNTTPRIPRTMAEFVEFMGQKGPRWKAQFAAIGLTNAQGTLIDTAATKLLAAYKERVDAEQALKNAVLLLKESAGESRELATNYLRVIDSFAALSAAPAVVFAAADVPPPADPKPVPAPGLPESFKVTLDQTGALNLSWKCPNPVGSAGVIYEIKRRLGTSGAYSFIGASGQRKFTDNTLPSGNATVGYQIQAVRTTVRGPVAQFNVNFGMGGGGFAIASVTEENVGGAKMAA